MKPLYIIKIGGSLLTDKSKTKSKFRKKIVSSIIKQIVEAKKPKNFNLILVHGAGAYPHFLTTKYGINDGFKGSKSAEGFVRIKNELFKLSNFLWEECLRQGLFVCGVQPSAVIFTENGQIRSFNTKLIDALLSMEIVPILMGDDSIDSKKGISVLSGDKIVAYLANRYKAKTVIFATDVDGIFDKNPKVHKDAKLIRVIDKNNFKKTLNGIEIHNVYDASGEMKGKLLAISRDLPNFKVQIVNGLKSGYVKRAIIGDRVGTLVIL